MSGAALTSTRSTKEVHVFLSLSKSSCFSLICLGGVGTEEGGR